MNLAQIKTLKHLVHEEGEQVSEVILITIESLR